MHTQLLNNLLVVQLSAGEESHGICDTGLTFC